MSSARVRMLSDVNTDQWDKIINHETYIEIKPSKMEVAPQGCLQITNKKTTNKIN